MIYNKNENIKYKIYIDEIKAIILKYTKKNYNIIFTISETSLFRSTIAGHASQSS